MQPDPAQDPLLAVVLHVRRERPLASALPQAAVAGTRGSVRARARVAAGPTAAEKQNEGAGRYWDFTVAYIVHDAVKHARAALGLPPAAPAAAAQGGPEAALELAAEQATLRRLGLGDGRLPRSTSGLGAGFGVSGDDGALRDSVARVVPSEAALYHELRHCVLAIDPDILLAYELQRASWGYVQERFAAAMPMLPPFSLAISRRSPATYERTAGSARNRYGAGAAPGVPVPEWKRYASRHDTDLTCDGRIVLNVWRILSLELKMWSSSLTATARDVLGVRLPVFAPDLLAAWIQRALAGATPCTAADGGGTGGAGGAVKALTHLAAQCRCTLDILSRLEVIDRTAQMAKTYGLRFYEVMHRGSQLKVEAMLLRVARPLQFLCVGMSPRQVAAQPGMECQALTLEPEPFSFYSSPIAVLDFRSLYPSICIAYNICYSTCLGRLSGADLGELMRGSPSPSAGAGAGGDTNAAASTLSSAFRVPLGGFELDRDWAEIRQLYENDALWISSTGALFVKATVREGALPRMLAEILETRFEVKAAMKQAHVGNKPGNSPDERERWRLYNALQLALKLIANVTYGFTAAGFSGRMPCQEIADAIVQTARDTLERAIALVNGHPRWRARVVYGDTDSMFVLFEGRTRAEAHMLAKEISDAVTASNPFPVHLEYEKVYQPCFIAAKKRYVGNKFEAASDKVGVIDCKGMEIVRRDSCPLLVKTMSQMLRILFNSNDMSAVRAYLDKTFYGLRLNRVPLDDLVFCSKVCFGRYKQGSTPPPAAMIAYRAVRRDPRAVPLYGERVPYIVVEVAGNETARLVDKIMCPRRYAALLARGVAPPVCARYYTSNVLVPALKRVLDLIGPAHASNLPVATALRPLPPAATGGAAGVVAAAFSAACGRLVSAAGDIRLRDHSCEPLYRTYGSLEGFIPAADIESWLHQNAAVRLPLPLPQAARADGSLGAAPDSSRPPGSEPKAAPPSAAALAAAGASLAHYVRRRQCATCGADILDRGRNVPVGTHAALCDSCGSSGGSVAVVFELQSAAAVAQSQLAALNRACRSCAGIDLGRTDMYVCVAPVAAPNAPAFLARNLIGSFACTCIDCPLMFRRAVVTLIGETARRKLALLDV
jgi:DNA polymerase zeta